MVHSNCRLWSVGARFTCPRHRSEKYSWCKRSCSSIGSRWPHACWTSKRHTCRYVCGVLGAELSKNSHLHNTTHTVLKVNETLYQDLLVECEISKHQRWIRFQLRKGFVSTSEDGAQCMLSSDCSVGTTVLVTNLKSGRAQGSCGIGVLNATDNSTLKVVSTAQPATCPSSPASYPNSRVFMYLPREPARVYSCLRSLHLRPSIASAEVSFEFTIVSWHTENSDDDSDSAASRVHHKAVSPCRPIEYKVFGVDAQRCGVVLTYAVPVALACRIPWLTKHATVRVDCAVIQQVDAPNDIVQVYRGDHTVIMQCYPGPAGSTAAMPGGRNPSRYAGAAKRPFGSVGVPVVTPGAALAALNDTHSAKKQRFEVPSSSTLSATVAASPAVVDHHLSAVSPHASISNFSEGLGDSTLKHRLSAGPTTAEHLPWVLEDENRRFSALRGCCKFFAPARQPQDLERCDRVFFGSATVGLVFTAPVPASAGGNTSTAITPCTSMAKVLITDSLTQAALEAWADPQLLALLSCDSLGGAKRTEYCVMVSECVRSFDGDTGASAGVDASTSESSWKLVWLSPAIHDEQC